MTKLLDEAIGKVRELPAAEQDEAAEILFSLIASRTTPVALDVETRAAREGLEQAPREFASDEQIAALFKRHGA
jgi:hypothetical protein